MPNINNVTTVHISSTNSTTTALGASEVFTGDWEDVQQFSDVIIAVATDVAGSYALQFSNDAENIDSTLTRYYRPAQINAPHRFTITRRWMRVIFTNNGDPQSYLRIQTSYGHERQPLNVPLDGTISQDYDATVVRPTDYHYEVAEGLRQGHRTFNKFGYNADVDLAAPETIWPVGGLYTPPTSASTLTIVSSSTDDDGDPAGTGARNIFITGLDANRKFQQEVVVMDGTTNVVTTSTWLGINRVAVGSCGSGQANAGNITITATTGGATLAYVPAGEGVTQQCIYHVQLQSTALADWLWVNVNKISGGGTPIVTVKGWVYSPVSNGKYEVFRVTIDTGVENTISINPEQPFVLNSGDVFWLEATTTVNDTIVNARFSLIEIQQAAYDPDS